MSKLLIVDDEAGYREVLKRLFEAEGYVVETAHDGKSALAKIKKNRINLVISDVRMPDLDGVELLRLTREIDVDICVVLMTAFGTIETARAAFALGADDFIQKPFNNEELKIIVKRALEKQRIVFENRALRAGQRDIGSLASIIGQSEKMTELFRMIEAVAREQSTILITGESGTGKELVARSVHEMSDRSDKPFIPINCGALTETLLESELFGYMKGAFTGAEQTRVGVFEAANGGTIFLDEIGDMTPAMQVKMLRVLQEQRVRRVGAAEEITVDTRVIAATHRDLGPMIEEGTFRRDLFYRIAVIPLEVPPLRERRDDIPRLVEHFVKKFSTRSGKTINLSAETLELLRSRDWHGNVRELEHTIERAVALTPSGQTVRAEYCADGYSVQKALRPEIPPEGLELQSLLHDLEREYVIEALEKTNNVQTRAAALLQMPVHALRHLLDKHGLR